MRKSFFATVLFLPYRGCIELFEFELADRTEGLVIESYISDKSFNQSLTFHSDGRYFTVVLTSTRMSPMKNGKLYQVRM